MKEIRQPKITILLPGDLTEGQVQRIGILNAKLRIEWD